MTDAQLIEAFAEAAKKKADNGYTFYQILNSFTDYVKYNRDVKVEDITNDDMKRYLDAYMNLS